MVREPTILDECRQFHNQLEDLEIHAYWYAFKVTIQALLLTKWVLLVPQQNDGRLDHWRTL